jgi:aryl sulfotransferase
MARAPEGMVWIASYPKSGNTWMRLLLANLFAEDGAPVDINSLALPGDIASSREVFEYQSLVDSHLLTDDEVDRLRPGVLEDYAARVDGERWMKCHDAYGRLADGTPILGRAARAALYLVRDPRDVAVSFAFHQSRDLEKVVPELDDAKDAMRSHAQVRQRLLTWSGHVASWLDQGDVPVHPIRYEDLLADTLGVFRRALDFLGVEYEPEEAARAVRHARFEELQRQELEKGFKERMRRQEMFFRQGEAGDWRRRLTQAQALAIETAHGEVMRRLGYEPAMEVQS